LEEQVMWHILGRDLTPYAVSIWIAGLAALGVFLWQGKRLKLSARLWTVGLGVLLGLLGARAYYVLARLELFLDQGLDNFFTASDPELATWGAVSGAAFFGAVGGVCLAALLAGRITKEKVSSILDALAPAAALGIAVSRLGENSIGEGIGPEVYEEGLQFFPLAVMNEWEEWNYALFLLEALAGLIIFVLLMTRGRKLTGGYRARLFLVLYCSSQIVFEALRRDNFLRWLFVRVSQVAAALILLGLVIFGLLRRARGKGEGGKSVLKTAGCAVLFFLGGFVGFLAVQLGYSLLTAGSLPEWSGALWWQLICDGWPVTLAVLAALAAVCILQGRGRREWTEKQTAVRLTAFLSAAVIVIAMEFGIDKSASLDPAVGYLAEALCCLIMGVSTWQLIREKKDSGDEAAQGRNTEAPKAAVQR
jgi:prolipoprotein diacylglyceryltransferase